MIVNQKMKNIFKRILPLALTAIIAAAPIAVRADDSATVIMERCVAQLSKPGAKRISFAITGENASSQGTLTFSGKRFKMETPQMTIWFDGTTQWTYIKDQKEVNVTEPTASELAESNPFELLRNYGSDFRCSRLKSSSAADVIELTSNSKDAPYSKAVLTVSKSTGTPSSMEVYFTNGASTSHEAYISSLQAQHDVQPGDAY